MTEVAPPDVKRRRIAADDSPHDGTRRLCDLPSGILAHVASFLAVPSRALFAIALDEDSAVLPNERSSAIVGNQLDTLDFGEIQKRVTKKLSDTDIEKVLLCIDGINKLKKLKLTNCVAITGTCLEPLCGTLVIEQIDLSLVGEHQNLDLDPQPTISCEHVLPILDSIIEREGCALMHLHFPSVWRKEPSADSEFHAFIGRYNGMRRNRGAVHCLKCHQNLPEGGEWIKTSTVSDYYGTQLYTCHGCLKHYCYKCNIDGDAEKYILNECATCRRDYCKGCSKMTHCSYCEKDVCNDCYECECVKCNKAFCSECVQEDKNVHQCDYCDKSYCRRCYDDEEVDIIHTCSRCDIKCCDDCRLQRYRQGLHCTECIKDSVLVFEHQRLQEENEELKVEMEALKRQIKDLKHENDELRSRNIE